MDVAPPVATALAFDHLVLVSTDVERTLAWYQRHLGLEGVRVEQWRAREAPFPSLRVDESTIIDVIPGELAPKGQRLDHVCFVVTADDLARLRSAPGITVDDEGARFGARGIGQSIYVRDPDGLTVEVRTYELGEER